MSSIPANPGITVVVPVRNYAEFVGEALDSALAQTYPNVEVLVIDDGSTDQTPTVLRRYGDRIRVVTQDNLGLSAARNAGLREASHAFVAFLDADDRYLPGMLSLLHGTLALVGQDCALVAAGNRYIDASGRPLDKRTNGPAETGEVTREDLLLRNRFAVCTVLARRDELLDIGGFDEELVRAEDRDLWIRLAERHRIMQVPDILGETRVHFRNMSRDADLMAEGLRQVLVAAIERRPIDPTWLRRCWGYYHHECAWMYHDANQRWQAVACELRSLATSPGPALRRDTGGRTCFRLRSLFRFLAGLHTPPALLRE